MVGDGEPVAVGVTGGLVIIGSAGAVPVGPVVVITISAVVTGGLVTVIVVVTGGGTVDAVGVGAGEGVGVGTGGGTGAGGASSVTVPSDVEEGTYEFTLNHSTTWTLASITCPTILYWPGAMLPGKDKARV